jgi:hypothetical protein
MPLGVCAGLDPAIRASIGGTIDVNAQLQTPASRQVVTGAVANRNKGGRARSRKRRRSGAAPALGVTGAGAASASETDVAQRDGQARKPAVGGARKRERPRGAAQRSAKASPAKGSAARASTGGGFRDPQSLGERPDAPWHPFPLSELLIFVGAIAAVIGLVKLKHGLASGGATLIAGVVAVLLGTVEFSFREHRSGYRSHTVLLALLPTVVLYTGTLLVIAAFESPVPVALKVAPLALALPLFALLFKLLRGRFQDARRERVFAGEK